MTRASTLLALGLSMALFHVLTQAGPLEARATVALGFLLLAAYAVGLIARQLGLPLITGYLVVGFFAGPTWANLVRADELEALRFVADAAAGLIAMAAGAHLRLDALRAGRIELVRTAAGALAGPFLLVTLVLLSVSPWFPLTAGRGLGDGLAVALMFGALAALSSPIVLMGMIDQYRTAAPPSGILARTLLTVSIAQDLAVILLFSAIVAIAELLTVGGEVRAAVVWPAAALLVASPIAGLGLGYLVTRYLRAVQAGSPILLLVLALVVAELARVAGLEPILVAAALGFYVENWGMREDGERLRAALNVASLPMCAVFFGLAGASLNLGALREWWAWILLVAGLRFWGIKGGLAWAARHPAVTPAVAGSAWTGLLAQAGVAVALAGLARRAFPAWGVTLEAMVLALVALHLLVGPILFRRAFREKGEAAEEMEGSSVAPA